MTDGIDDVRCSKCGQMIEEAPGTLTEERIPCPTCGSTTRRFGKTLAAAVSVRGFVDGKKRSQGLKSRDRLRVHLQLGDQIDHKTGRWVFKQRRVDKDQSPAWYFERITDGETGAVIHECSEPLDEHTEHGSARPSL
jgi:DNA-directed RNA polymerase subunit RPC12/RpoP